MLPPLAGTLCGAQVDDAEEDEEDDGAPTVVKLHGPGLLPGAAAGTAAVSSQAPAPAAAAAPAAA